MKKKILSVLLIGLLVANITSCKKGKDDEEELITTLKVKLTPTTGGTTQIFTFKDADGPGGAAPSVFNPIVLERNKVYNCQLELLNESSATPKDITAEIVREANDHQFYYSSTTPNLTISNLNNDSKGLPLGTTATFTTTAAATGAKLQIVLKHKPGKKAAGDPVTKGDTDIELPNGGFDLTIQ